MRKKRGYSICAWQRDPFSRLRSSESCLIRSVWSWDQYPKEERRITGMLCWLERNSVREDQRDGYLAVRGKKS